MDEHYMTYHEAAEKLGVSKVTVQRWARAGQLSRVRLRGKRGLYLKPAEVVALKATLATESRGPITP